MGISHLSACGKPAHRGWRLSGKEIGITTERGPYYPSMMGLTYMEAGCSKITETYVGSTRSLESMYRKEGWDDDCLRRIAMHDSSTKALRQRSARLVPFDAADGRAIKMA